MERTTAFWVLALWTTILLACAPPRGAAAATLFPLVTEDAVPLAHGVAEFHFGAAYFRNQRFPAFTPPGAVRSHDLFSLPNFGLRIGAGDWVEIQASFEFLLVDEVIQRGSGARHSNTTWGGGDARLFTKARLFDERGPWPAVGLRFGTKLPNAKRADRLGTDETDFHIETLFSRDFGVLTAHANMGIAILGNSGPMIAGDRSFSAEGQDDLFTWSLALAGAERSPVGAAGWTWRPLAELRGSAGSRFDNDGAGARFGLQTARGPWTTYAGMSVGFGGAAEDVGAMIGAWYRFAPGAWFE